MNKIIDLRAFTNSVNVPTLVLLDLQEEYLAQPRALAIDGADEALENCRLALDHARSRGFPIAYTRWIGNKPYFNPATPFCQWIRGFEPIGSDLVFERDRPSCYASPLFSEVMSTNGGHFVLAGFAGEVSCLATAIEAFHRGHMVTYLSDASASHAIGEREPADVHGFVKDLMGVWINVTTTKGWIGATSRAKLKRGIDVGTAW